MYTTMQSNDIFDEIKKHRRVYRDEEYFTLKFCCCLRF